MALVWATGVSGSGKSSVCEALQAQCHVAADSQGFSWWVSRVGEPVVDPPYRAP